LVNLGLGISSPIDVCDITTFVVGVKSILQPPQKTKSPSEVSA
jgi:hypothetical protein